MRALRFSKWWMGLGLVLLLIVLYLCLEPSDGSGEPLLHDKLAHFLAFVGLTVWFAALVERRYYPYVVLAMLLLGGLIEVAQDLMAFGRSADVFDFLADAIGVAAGVAISLPIRESWFERIERWLAPT